MTFSKGQFGYDLEFLKKSVSPIVLSSEDGLQQVIVSPQLQGRILTSTAQGLTGKSFGWINHELIASRKIQKHINAYGGEDRFWLAPEAGQFGLFFKPGAPFDFENYQVPAALDTEPFELVGHDSISALLKKETSVINYSNTKFQIRVERKINLLSHKKISSLLQIDFENNLSAFGFESENTLTNTGN